MHRPVTAIFCPLLALAALGGCSRDRAIKKADAIHPPSTMAVAAAKAGPMAAGTVVETMDAAEYTYVRVKTGTGDIWAAAGKFNVKVGDKVIVPVEMPMENFHSNTLNRTFPTIYFTSRIFHEGDADAPQAGR